MLRETMIDGTVFDKVQKSIDRLRAFEPAEGYWLAFSGGKDSIVIKALADMAGVKYEAHYSLTTVDPPELVQFIKTFSDVVIDKPKLSMWRLIEKKMIPPTRLARYCCSEMKESHGEGRITITGIRWAESSRRAKNANLITIGFGGKEIIYNDENDESRRMVESCYRTQKTLVNPIINWGDDDVWEFIREYNIPYCSLYDEGFKRLGCIGCPLGSGMEKELERWPTYQRAYIRAFDLMLARRKERGRDDTGTWKDGKSVYDWWIGKTPRNPISEDQMDMFEDYEEQ